MPPLHDFPPHAAIIQSDKKDLSICRTERIAPISKARS
jgi:hypothetical protein